ncbi:hypothetical protein LEP1GSC070_0648 [Leptospira santarosai str. AIM]|nr:hypothetical protein LEP1GSC070_0648 [Leptospira santarosai str. AIM]
MNRTGAHFITFESRKIPNSLRRIYISVPKEILEVISKIPTDVRVINHLSATNSRGLEANFSATYDSVRTIIIRTSNRISQRFFSFFSERAENRYLKSIIS